MTAIKTRSSDKYFFVLVAVALALFFSLMTSPAFANGVDASSNIGKDEPLVTSLVSSINASEGHDILAYDSSTGILSFKNSLYSSLETKDRREYMKTALDAIEKSDLAQQRKSKMYNFVYDQDTGTTATIRQFSSDSRADTMGAFALLKPFNGFIGIILGVVAVLTLMFLAFSIIVDLCYIVIPFVQVMLSSTTDKKPMLISNEAYNAVKISESTTHSGDFRNPAGVYLKTRSLSMFLIVLILMYLISGQLFNFIGLITDMVMDVTSGN